MKVYETKQTFGMGGQKFERVRDTDVPAPTEPAELAAYEADLAEVKSSVTCADQSITPYGWRVQGGFN